MTRTDTPHLTGAILVAAGRGTRAGGGVPKQWRPLLGRSVADWTVEAFRRHPRIGPIVLVIHPDDTAQAAGIEGVALVTGGATRDASVRAGLAALAGRAARVLVHDVARATVPASVLDAVIDALDTHPGAAPALAVTDALWRGTEGRVAAAVPRDGLFRAQTPQGFDLAALIAAHAAHPGGAADDVEVARAAGLDVAIVPGHEDNLKITTPDDFARAEAILRGRMDIRVGNGFDVHRFGPGTAVTLCGVEIAHTRGLQGHSDADVGMHAVTDAIYGALADGDIGQHFPPSDPQWKGAGSHIFLTHAVGKAAAAGFSVAHVDCTLICEYPKIGPQAAAMRAALARLIGIEDGRVSVKATTSERLGFTGREEGIAALATVTLVSA